MNSDRPTPNAGGAAKAASKASASRGNCYVASAALPDVMFDQLKYLLAHSGRDCTPDCLDCGRLQQVKKLLLLPFHSVPPAKGEAGCQ
jgi:hypothetical protein